MKLVMDRVLRVGAAVMARARERTRTAGETMGGGRSAGAMDAETGTGTSGE